MKRCARLIGSPWTLARASNRREAQAARAAQQEAKQLGRRGGRGEARRATDRCVPAFGVKAANSSPAQPAPLSRNRAASGDGPRPLPRASSGDLIAAVRLFGSARGSGVPTQGLGPSCRGCPSEAAWRDRGRAAPRPHLRQRRVPGPTRAAQLLGISVDRATSAPHNGVLPRPATGAARSTSFAGLWSATCTRRGFEVILDVVFNHTAEGSEYGPTLVLSAASTTRPY